MRVASQLLGKHQSTVGKIFWDVQVDGQPRKNRFYRRYSSSGKYAEHEAFFPGDSIGINCAVPATISPDDLLSLMEIAGRYCGISPYKPRKYGFFEIVSVRQRRIHTPESDFGRSVKDEDRIADDKESHFAKSGRDEKVREPPDNRSDHG